MANKNEFCNIGSQVKTSGPTGVSIAGKLIEVRDFEDCKISVEHCGGNVFEVWLHTSNKYSVRLLVESADLEKIGNAFISSAQLIGGK